MEEIEPSEVQILIDGNLRETKAVSSNRSEIAVPLTPQSPGEYDIELVAETDPPEEIRHLQQQDDLEFSPGKARVAWEVTVQPARPQFEIGQVWKIVTHFLAFRELVSLMRDYREWLRDRLNRSGSDDDDSVNTTLDEFHEE